MKLSFSLLLLTFLHVSATVHSQDKLTLTARSVSWEKLFDLLEKRSSYTFLYKDNVLPRKDKIDVDATDLTVPQILDNAFRNTKLTYQVLSSHLVVITPRNEPAIEEIKISGKVVSASGDPLSGATIRVKGSTVATKTDSSGNFTLNVPEDATLVASFVGYQALELPVAGSTRLTFTLQPLAGSLNEVVVIGYGTARKKDLTGSVSTISARNINDIPVGGVDQIMQGKAAGVAITQVTGAPGDGVTVRIRGIGTINNNDPLYIVDGIPTKDGINEISPNDIESISVLKDASSASIYGARASNGVVVITTKKGVSGKPRVSINAYAGSQQRGHLIKMANTPQYVNAFNIAAANDGRTPIPLGMLDSLPDVNWQKAVLKPAALVNAQLSVSGGNENTKYIVSGAYFTQKGMIDNSGNERANLHTAITSKLSKIFTVGTNMNLAYSKTRQVGSSGDGYGAGNPGASVVRYALFRTPATPIYDKNGNFTDLPNPSSFFGDGLNPVGLAANTNRNFYNYTLLGDAYLEITPINHLKIKSDIGTNEILTEYKQFFPTWGGGGTGVQNRLQNSPNSLSQYYQNNFNYNWTNTATYDWIKDKHVVNILAGTEIIYNDTKILSASQTNFANQGANFQYLSNGSGSTNNVGGNVGGNEVNSALTSLFGRIGYTYDDKYLATFNVRRDGSSRLDPNNRYGNFYSGSVGWRIDKENFMKDIKPISLLKVRASLGQLGNQEIGNYGYASLIGPTGYYPFGSNPAQTYTIYSNGDQHVRWETSTIADAGLDLGLFEGALNITADYFRKKTSNLLVNPPNPTSAGAIAAPAFENNGSVLNRGFEFEVSYRKELNKDWHFEISGNLATIHNEVLSLLNNQPLPAGRIDNNVYATSTAVGHPIGAFYLLQQEGIFQTPLDVFTHAYQAAGIKPGDVKFKDVNGDGVIDANDRVFAGSPIPKFTYGFTGNLSYKQFDLSLFFQGVNGNKIYNQVNTDIEGFYRAFNITERTATKSWTGPGTSNTLPRLSWTGAQNNKQASTRFLESGSYLRLKNLQVGYNLSPTMLTRMKVSSLRLFISAQNVFTITKYTGQDPEMAVSADATTAGDGVKAVGIDWGTYPSARTFTAGININF